MRGVGTKTIETDRLILRRITVNDAKDMFKNWTNDLEVSKYVTWDCHGNLDATIEYAKYKENRYEKEYCFDWVVVLKETNEAIGEIEAVKVSLASRLVEVGYCFGSSFWNQGYATEALKAFIQYMFKIVNVEKIIACHMSSNPASGKVMLKAGMHFDAVLKNYVVNKITNTREDLLYYSIDNK